MRRTWFIPRERDISKTRSSIIGHWNNVLFTETKGLTPVPPSVPLLDVSMLSPAQALDCRGLINGPPQLFCSHGVRCQQSQRDVLPRTCLKSPKSTSGSLWTCTPGLSSWRHLYAWQIAKMLAGSTNGTWAWVGVSTGISLKPLSMSREAGKPR